MGNTIRSLATVVILLALGATLAQAGPVPELPVPRVAQPPQIDGRLDEACWQSAPPITDFRCVNKERSAATQRTESWVACDADALYVAARCHDDHMDQVQATVTGSDGAVWKDDCLEVFLMPGAPYYYHFAANLLGTRYDARHSLGAEGGGAKPEGWSAEWHTACRREADCWIMEIAIPFACLEWGAERVSAPFRFNIGREQRRLAEFSCWPASGFSKTEEFALLGGLQVDPQRYGLLLKDVSVGTVTPGANRYTATVAEEPMPGSRVILRARVQVPPRGPERLHTIVLRSEAGARLQLDYQLPLTGGLVAVTFEVIDSDSSPRVSRSEVWRVPAPLEGSLDLPLLYQSDGQVRLSGRVALRGQVKLVAALVSGGRSLSSTSVAVGADGDFHVGLPVRTLAPGRYAVETRLTVPGVAAEPLLSRFPFQLIAGPLD